MSKKIYLDNAATTAVRPEVLDVMLPFYQDRYGNASSIYSFGSSVKTTIEESRKKVADLIGARDREVYFTSGGTESDNWAIKGTAFALRDKGKHIITTKIEHHAVLHTCEYLEEFGYEVTYLDVDEYGLINLEELEDAIREDTILITVMYANNEIGTIQPIKEIGEIAKKHDVLFHTDAVQAMGSQKIDVKEMNIDMMSMSGHKVNGPKGVGALYIRMGVRIDNYMHGGAQERNRRAGTENVAGIVGMTKALELAYEGLEERNNKYIELRDGFIKEVMERIPHVKLNGHPTKRLPNNINLSFLFIEGESLLLSLDLVGIQGSSGSACTSGSLDPSHVLMALGLDHETAHGSLRLTLSEDITKEDLSRVVDELEIIVERLRSMSPLYDAFIEEEK